MISNRKQQGVVLITSLVLLVILTLLATSLLKTSVIELKIGGAHQIAAQNLANAEAEITNYVNATNFPTAGFPNWVSANASYTVNYDNGDTVQITTPAQGSCIEDPESMMGSGLYMMFKDVRAEAQSVLGGETVVHQGVRARVASCA